MTIAAVSDAGPLIHLAEINALELCNIFDVFFVPKTVCEELEAGSVPTGLSELSFEIVTAESSSSDPAKELDPGERAAIAVAKDTILFC